MSKSHKYEIDMLNGNLFIKMLKFCIPLILSGILQLLYNAADLVVVSNFSTDKEALGAVGSCGSLISLIVNLFMGMSVGTNVICAGAYARGDKDYLKKAVHTSLLTSLILGILLGIFGFFASDYLLTLMKNDLSLSRLYLKIYFIGLPFNMLYNFAAAILRAVGDTKRPLYILSIAGLFNVLLNLVFVICFKMSVGGVALATIISQLISSALIIFCLVKSKEAYKVCFKDLKISKRPLFSIIRIGFPAGLQASIFSISNVLIQSSVNAFGFMVMNGNSSAQSLEGFVYTSMNSVYHASLSFTGQNVSVKKYGNIKKIVLSGLAIVSIIGILMGGTMFIFGKEALSIYTKVPGEIEVGYIRLHYLVLPYFLCGIMDVMCGVIRGLGYAILPMMVSLVGACGLRVLWIIFIFRPYTSFVNINDLNLLYISYPISWMITFIAHFICYLICFRRTKNLDIRID